MVEKRSSARQSLRPANFVPLHLSDQILQESDMYLNHRQSESDALTMVVKTEEGIRRLPSMVVAGQATKRKPVIRQVVSKDQSFEVVSSSQGDFKKRASLTQSFSLKGLGGFFQDRKLKSKLTQLKTTNTVMVTKEVS